MTTYAQAIEDAASEAKRWVKLRVTSGPECPHCGMDGFDDWRHEPTVRLSGSALSGRLKCHGCGKFFSITHFANGQTHSTAWSKAR